MEGVDLVGGHGLPRQLRFENFVCRNKRIWNLRGRALGMPPRSTNDFGPRDELIAEGRSSDDTLMAQGLRFIK